MNNMSLKTMKLAKIGKIIKIEWRFAPTFLDCLS